jgi:probable HAF family extracellular repeat protein
MARAWPAHVITSRVRRVSRLTALLAFAICLASAEAAPPKGKPLVIPLPPQALAADVGAGGFVVLGNFYSGGALTWMPTSGVTRIGGTGAAAVSLDGKTLVGRALDSASRENAAISQEGEPWRVLGSFTPDAQPCDLLLSAAYGASDDGKVVVGLGWNGCKYAHAFRWEDSTGMVDLGTLNGESTRANNVSGDGKVVVGWQQDVTGPRLGAKWVNGAQEMIQGPHGPVGEAFAANRDGSLIVGSLCQFASRENPNPTPSGWMWTAANGVKCLPVEPKLGLPNVPRIVYVMATSEDGRVFGGSYSFGLESEALIWFDGEPFFLRDYLRDNGIPDAFEGWVNTGFVLNMTPDGRTLVGYGAGPVGFQGFMIILPELD